MGLCVSPRDARNAAKGEKKKMIMSACEFFSSKKQFQLTKYK